MPVFARRLAQHRGASDVGLDEGERIHQRPVDVSLRGEVDDGVRLGRKRVDQVHVADVAMDESITGPALELDQVGEVAGIRELVEHGYLDVRPRAAEVAYEIRADETGGARDEEPLQRAAHLIGGPAVQS